MHGGPYYALLVTRGQNGSVSLNCRYRDQKGTFCAESELWDSIGLDPRRFAGGQAAIAPPEDASEARGQSSPATNGHSGAPPRDAPSHEPVNPGKDDSHAEMLLRIAAKGRIFRGSDNRFYAQVPLRDHHEIYELGSPSFERWLNRAFRQDRQALPTLESINRLVRASEADAAVLSSTESVWVRVAAGGGRTASQADRSEDVPERIAAAGDCGAVYYLDLGDSSGDAVEIRPGGGASPPARRCCSGGPGACARCPSHGGTAQSMN